MIDKRVEEKLLLPMLTSFLAGSISSARPIVDKGNPDERDCDWFELFFAIDPNCGDNIDPETADGSQAIFELAQGACALILERYGEHYQANYEKIACIGVCLESEWFWGEEELPELEAMIGTVYKKDALVGCWRFAVRFAPAPYQIEGRCLSAEPIQFDEKTDPYNYLQSDASGPTL